MSFVNAQAQSVTIEAVRYPPCVCGIAYGHHRGNGNCQGYRPIEPVESLGVVGFSPSKTWPLWTQFASGAIWRVECILRAARERVVAHAKR